MTCENYMKPKFFTLIHGFIGTQLCIYIVHGYLQATWAKLNSCGVDHGLGKLYILFITLNLTENLCCLCCNPLV